MDDVLLAELVDVSAAVAATAARSKKIALIAALLTRAGAGDAAEVEIATAYLAGDVRQRRTGVGWAGLRDLPPPAPTPSLTLQAVDAAIELIAGVSGSGSQARRAAALAELFAAATADEQQFLVALLTGELRQGALEGVMLDAVAKAAGVGARTVRQAFMARGSLPPVASIAMREGAPGLEAIELAVGRAVQPMLAQPAPSVADAMAKAAPAGGECAVEWKLDGIRVQLHRDGDTVAVFTRTLDDITSRVPELVAAARTFEARAFILDGEAIALDEHGRPRPFQETAARTSSKLEVERLRVDVPLSLFVFDVLQRDHEVVRALPASQRQHVLEELVPAAYRVPRVVTADPQEASALFADAIAHGHEGVVVKALDAPYEAGRRGAAWVKVKPRHTLDLVVLAAEWGHGRRRGFLSNLHLGARDDDGGFVMLGKTFKGLTDQLLAWQTERLLELETGRDAYTVFVRPELVVEVAFDGVQASPRYPGKVALRFARVLRYRPDKRAADADHLAAVLAVQAGGAHP